MLTCVLRIGNAITEVEVERLQQTILEEVALNHSKVFHVFVADLKLDAIKKGRECKSMKQTAQRVVL